MEQKTSGWRVALSALGAWARPIFRKLFSVLAIYLDDLLMIAAGVCFVSAAGEWGGRAPALCVSGICLLAYAVVVARAGRGRGNR